ncbi:19515_t:CDS:2, partial [Rhizophagus irregularis]
MAKFYTEWAHFIIGLYLVQELFTGHETFYSYYILYYMRGEYVIALYLIFPDVMICTPNPVVIKKGGDNKLHIDVSWEGLAIGEKDKVVTKLTCFSTAVTVKDSPQNHLYGDGKATYEVTVNEKGKLVHCRSGLLIII